jgi:hypothetical protein
MDAVLKSIHVLSAAMLLTGCSGFGGSKPEQAVDPNVFPANYRMQIATLLKTTLTDRTDFQGALIAQPVMKSLGDSQHYVVCLRFNGRQPKNKIVIFLSGTPTQYVDSKPEQCGDAAYAPFQDLADVTPPK